MHCQSIYLLYITLLYFVPDIYIYNISVFSKVLQRSCISHDIFLYLRPWANVDCCLCQLPKMLCCFPLRDWICQHSVDPKVVTLVSLKFLKCSPALAVQVQALTLSLWVLLQNTPKEYARQQWRMWFIYVYMNMQIYISLKLQHLVPICKHWSCQDGLWQPEHLWRPDLVGLWLVVFIW